ncbi:MAG: hypothetical protein ACLFUB_15280 [Cyclobacteriaceae bacterium]
MRFLSIFISVLLLSTACQELQKESSTENFDTDTSNYASNPEVGEQFSDNNYNDWDVGREDARANDRLYKGFYEIWDVNQDGFLDEKEWAYGTEHYLDNYDGEKYGYFSDWDTQSDDRVEVGEFVYALSDTPYYTGWDENNNDELDRDEFAQGDFDIFSESDERVSREEFDQWEPDFEM